jgi:hypothetical protein
VSKKTLGRHKAWKNDTAVSIGDLSRAVESKGREESRKESEVIINNLCDALGDQTLTKIVSDTPQGVAA